MSTAPRPCPHCGNQNLVFVPNMLIDIAKGASVLGMRAVQDLKIYWNVTLVICNQCGCTQTFSQNTAEVATAFGGNVQTVPLR
ncbi:MAG: hypothetical protein IPG17_29415 [Sandaracinaceae bacterium]|nr:hypothetical protein [Sandaracinaceae bacterium]MBP7681822.1 hypothetical protein [Deltaproteobacteria bacterium]MBK6812013.1 hypothetical protein [Sandaracinaceae bacterium]MBK7156576.1 hypothetical protein [Sandaracinaceae bacterium]MBK7777827.1 hypothetical protein [Sandaracinaceae bacterium]